VSIIDDRGRLFGRLNIVDATIVAFAIVLVPLAYGTYLLFRPAQPRIDSVAPSDITVAERRIGNGSALTAKFKIRGSGFTPLLRAKIGSADALGLVFESPNSADVLVGPVPPGKHDLILVDGVQEVARANGAIEILASSGTPLRASGWLFDMEKTAAAAVKAGETIPASAPSSFQIVAVGPERPGRARTRFGGGVAEGDPNGLIDREAVLILKCDAPPLYDVCSIGGQMISGTDPVVVVLPGGYRYELHEVLPMTAPAAATVTVRFAGPAVSLVQPGDQDQLLDSRGAKVTAVTGRDASSATVTLALGVDASREGWRYRGQIVRPGGPFAITTSRYETTGQVLSISLQSQSATASK
jgi:hypothetical protein